VARRQVGARPLGESPNADQWAAEPSVPDVLIAATAELAGLTVLHLDRDFDLIVTVTGQVTERLP